MTMFSPFYPDTAFDGVQGTTLPSTRNVNRGDWTALANGTVLNVGDIVQYLGSSYIVVTGHTKGVGTAVPSSNSNYTLLAQSGTNGLNGSNGLNTAQVFLYQRAASTPALPSVSTTYTFSTGVLTGQNNGWSQAIPASNGQPLYVTVASASSATSTDTIAANEWAAATIMAQDGSNGVPGADGINTATVYLYQRASSTPAVPSATTTYTFSSGVLTGITNGWLQTVPSSNGQPLYVTTATALSSGATDTIATGEWAAPHIMAQDGATGSSGLHNASVFLYQRAASQPAVPSVTTTYTFATGVLTGQNNGWSTTIPAVNGQPLYVTVATASNTAATDTIATGEWATPVIMTTDGTSGTNGINTATIFLYQRASSAPPVPSVTTTYTFSTGSLTGVNNGWSQTVPNVNGQPLYVITATALSNTSTDSIIPTEWSTPSILAQDGASGISAREITVFQRNSATPATPSGGSYNFTTSTVTAPSGWSVTIPTGANPLWAARGQATVVGQTGTVTPTWLGVGQVAADGNGVNVIFQRSDTQPATPSPSSTVPAGWYDTVNNVPAGTGYIWSSFGSRPDSGSNYTWQTPVSIIDPALTAVVTAISDDNVLSGPEKSQKLIPLAAQFESRYSYWVARAALVGVSTTLLSAARTNWLSYLNNIFPAWNDSSQSSTLYNSAFGDQLFPTNWSLSGGLTTTANAGYTTLTDASTSTHGNIVRTKTQSGTARYSMAVIVKKDSIPKTTRSANLRFNRIGSTPTDLTFDTSTGEYLLTGTAVNAYGILDMGSEWLVWIDGNTDASTTALQLTIYPAISNQANFSFVTATTGSIDVRPPVLANGSSANLGRAMLVARANDYEVQLVAVQKAISELDAQLANQVTGPASFIAQYDSSGTTPKNLPSNLNFKLQNQSGQVTSGITWKVVIISGTVNGSSAGATEYAMTNDGGTGVWQFNSMVGSTAKIEIRAYIGSMRWAFQSSITKELAAPSGSGGGGGGTLPQSGNASAFLSSTTFVKVGTITGTTGAGQTSVSLSASCDISDTSFAKTDTATVELKWMRSGVQKGSTGSGTCSISNYEPIDGVVSASATDTGLTANTSYSWELWARVTVSGKSVNMNGGGTVT